MKKWFDYSRVPNYAVPRKQWVKRPRLPVTLFNGDKRQNMYALIDSGADDCLFHSSIGKRLGIDVPSGTFKRFGGITEGIDAYMHPIQLQVQGFSERILIIAGFTDADGVDGLLGQAGFLESYQVIFERYHWQFVVIDRSEAVSV
jgi:hypothetical protein